MNQKQEDKRARLNEIRQRLANMSDAEKAALLSRGIIATVEGRALSYHNCYMLYLQSNGKLPTIVAGYKQWKAAGRQVMKGQHGMTILFPAGRKDEETGEVEAEYFCAGTVFDISQTETLAPPEPQPALS